MIFKKILDHYIFDVFTKSIIYLVIGVLYMGLLNSIIMATNLLNQTVLEAWYQNNGDIIIGLSFLMSFIIIFFEILLNILFLLTVKVLKFIMVNFNYKPQKATVN